MNKKFLKWQFKKWIPFFAICLSFLLIIYLIELNNISYSDTIYCTQDNVCNTSYTADSGIFQLATPAFLLSIIVPFIVYSYRQNASVTDCIYQLPFEKTGYKINRHILALAMFLITFTLGYLFAMLLIGVKVSIYAGSAIQPIGDYQPLGYFYLYLYMLLELTCSYFIASFFIGLGNNYVESVVLLLGGEILSSSILAGPASFINYLIKPTSYFNNLYAPGGDMSLDLSALAPIHTANALLHNAILPSSYSHSARWPLILCLVIFSILGILAVAYVLFKEDQSGELSGQKDNQPKWIGQILYAAFFFTSFYPGSFLSLTTSSSINAINILYVFLTSFLYYILISFYHSSPKLKKSDWLEFACCTVLAIGLYEVTYELLIH